MKKIYSIILAIGFLTMGALEANGSAALESSIAPNFTTRPRDCTVSTGVTVQFSCHVIGDPIPNIEILKNGKKFNTQNEEKYAVSYKNGEISLTIYDVAPEDKGVYSFRATNSAGMASINVTLYVISTQP